MPIQHAVLALLAEGPSYGYQLKSGLEAAVGPQWGVNIGHVYQVLDRLHRDGLVTAATVAQAKRPDRTVYQLTAAGRAELDAWLAQPVVRSTGYRDDVFLKLVAATRRDLPAVRQVIRTQRQQHLAELKSLAELRTEHASGPLVGLLVEAAALHVQGQLRWLDLVEERAAALVAQATAAAESAPARTDVEPPAASN